MSKALRYFAYFYFFCIFVSLRPIKLWIYRHSKKGFAATRLFPKIYAVFALIRHRLPNRDMCVYIRAYTGGSTPKQSQGQSRLRPSVRSSVKSSSVLMSSSNLWCALLRVKKQRIRRRRAEGSGLSFPTTFTFTSLSLSHSLSLFSPQILSTTRAALTRNTK